MSLAWLRGNISVLKRAHGALTTWALLPPDPVPSCPLSHSLCSSHAGFSALSPICLAHSRRSSFAWVCLPPGTFFLQICMANSLSSVHTLLRCHLLTKPSLFVLCKTGSLWHPSPTHPASLLCFPPSPHSMYCLLAFNIIYLLILFILWVYFVH